MRECDLCHGDPMQHPCPFYNCPYVRHAGKPVLSISWRLIGLGTGLWIAVALAVTKGLGIW